MRRHLPPARPFSVSRLQGVCSPELGHFHTASPRGSPVTPGTLMNVGYGGGRRRGHVCAGGWGGSEVTLVFLLALPEASEAQPRPVRLGPLTLLHAQADFPGRLAQLPALWFRVCVGRCEGGDGMGVPLSPRRSSRLRLGQGSGPLLATCALSCGGQASPHPPGPGRVPAPSCTVPPAGPSTGLPASVAPDAGSDSPRAESAGRAARCGPRPPV